MLKLILMINLLSLGGLPPFLGFYPKLLIIELLISNNYFILNFILIFFSLIILLIYLRITYFTLFINSIYLKNYLESKKYKPLIFYSVNLNRLILIVFIVIF